MWGKNFDPDEHEETLRKAVQNRYYPTVDVYLPVCCEPTHLLDNTWKHVGALDYPNFTVHVLDDGGKEEVRQLARLHGFHCGCSCFARGDWVTGRGGREEGEVQGEGGYGWC